MGAKPEMDAIQYEVREWTARNFAEKTFHRLAVEIVETLKPAMVPGSREVAVKLVQATIQHRIGHLLPLIGMVEELGEISHAVLKEIQEIRTGEDHKAAIKDGIGDLQVFGMDFSNRRGISMGGALDEVWAEVRERDWTADPESGGRGDADPESGGQDDPVAVLVLDEEGREKVFVPHPTRKGLFVHEDELERHLMENDL